MANSYEVIDEKTWKRAVHCTVFRYSSALPYRGLLLHIFLVQIQVRRITQHHYLIGENTIKALEQAQPKK